jgi:lysophospholipase L1-like esterase
MTADASHFYTLASGSRRRRRFLLHLQQEEASFAPVRPESGDGFRVDSSASTGERPHGVLLVRDMLEDAAPRTWLFTGDTLGFDARKSKRGWVEFFSDKIKVELQRRLDVVLDTAVRDSLVSTLRRNADWRILRFQPDVVFLMLSPREAAAGDAGHKRFHVDLTKLVERLEEEGTVVALCTPPCVSGPDDHHRNLSRYAEIICEVAAGTDAILIDHCQHWGRMDSHVGLLDPNGIRPTFAGHQALAGHLFETLGIGGL